VNTIYFCYNGIAAFVLPKFENLIYGLIEKGDFLGLTDMIPNLKEKRGGDSVITGRKFSVMCLTEWSEFLTLTLEDLENL
jgi:hypothetical protein